MKITAGGKIGINLLSGNVFRITGICEILLNGRTEYVGGVGTFGPFGTDVIVAINAISDCDYTYGGQDIGSQPFYEAGESKLAYINTQYKFFNEFIVAQSVSSSAPTVMNGAVTTTGTLSAQLGAATDIWLSRHRKRFASATTPGSVAGLRTALAQWFSGDSAGSGFLANIRFGFSNNLAGTQKFVGLCASGSALAGEPSALVNMLGVGYDSTDSDTGNLFFMHKGASGGATRIDLGTIANRAAINEGYELEIYSEPGVYGFYCRLRSMSEKTVLLDQLITVNAPANNVYLALKLEARNGATSLSDEIEFSYIKIQSDAA